MIDPIRKNKSAGSSPVAIFWFDSKFTCSDCSMEATIVLQKEKIEIVGRNLTDIFETRPELERIMEQVFRTGAAQHACVSFKNGQRAGAGRTYRALFLPEREEAGKVAGAIVFGVPEGNGDVLWNRAEQEEKGEGKKARDKSGDLPSKEKRAAGKQDELEKRTRELKQVNESLRASKAVFESLAKVSPVGIFRTDGRGDFIYVNKRWRQICGQTRNEALREGWLRAVHPADRERIEIEWRSSIRTRRPFKSEYRLEKDGFITYVLGQALPQFQQGKVIGYVGTITDITDQKRTEKTLTESEAQLRSLSSKLLTAQEEERKRIANELHDTIGQTLAAIKFWVEMIIQQWNTIDSEEILKRLQMFVPILQRSIEETRAIYMGLRPTILDSMGIIATLQWLCRDFQKMYPRYYVELKTTVEEDAIPAQLRTGIFRITQEALNNIAKHSRAEWVDIILAEEEGQVRLTIVDDGIGFDVNRSLSLSHGRSLGLTAMRERAEIIGGAFSIVSVPGKGTTVRTSWPSEQPWGNRG